MNGTYNVSLHTPIGVQKGTVTLMEENGALRGSIRAMGSTSTFQNGKVSGNAFEFSGILNAGFFNFSYTAKGTIDGDTLNAVATTNTGAFQIIGTRQA